jgi:DNA-binding transcriptional regulator YdaS (Cro superfamily)
MDTNTLIDELGGTKKVADLCNVSDQAVSQWRKNGIPPARLMYLKLARPKLFNKQQ